MAPLIATMPALPIGANYTVEWVAIDPTSGADVSGVTVTNPALYGIDLSGGGVSHMTNLPPVLEYAESAAEAIAPGGNIFGGQ